MNKLGLICLSIFFLAFIFVKKNVIFENKMKEPKNKANILKELDSVFMDMNIASLGKNVSSPTGYNFFLDLEHPYVETAGSRIHLFGDNDNWAVVFEKVGYSTPNSSIECELNFIGNCINYKTENYGQGNVSSNTEYLEIVGGDDLLDIEMPENDNGDNFEMVNPKAKYVRVRHEKVRIEHDKTKYKERNIELISEDNPNGFISFGNLARYLYSTEKEKICAKEGDLRLMLPKGLPFVMTIDDFHFETSYQAGNLPSKQETYNLIAEVLVSLDKTKWQPQEKANNAWYNWKSGYL